MNLFNLDYSGKNIPIPSAREYTKRLLEKTEELIKRMRWKALFFLSKEADTESDVSTDGDDEVRPEYYGLKSKRSPPQIKELMDFEHDLLNMVENVQFKNTTDDFQSKLSDDVKDINSSPDIFVQADKTRNMYTMKPAEYNKLLTENITMKYKTAATETSTEIETEFKTIAAKLDVAERINQTAKTPAFITIKDHKENFQANTKCRLL